LCSSSGKGGVMLGAMGVGLLEVSGRLGGRAGDGHETTRADESRHS
jgi:hypothetical protein